MDENMTPKADPTPPTPSDAGAMAARYVSRAELTATERGQIESVLQGGTEEYRLIPNGIELFRRLLAAHDGAEWIAKCRQSRIGELEQQRWGLIEERDTLKAELHAARNELQAAVANCTPAIPLSEAEAAKLREFIDALGRSSHRATVDALVILRKFLAAHSTLATENATRRAERDAAVKRAEQAERERDKIMERYVVPWKDGWIVYSILGGSKEFQSLNEAVACFRLHHGLDRKAAGLTPAGEEVGGG